MNNLKTQISSLLNTICMLDTEEKSKAVCYLKEFVSNFQADDKSSKFESNTQIIYEQNLEILNNEECNKVEQNLKFHPEIDGTKSIICARCNKLFQTKLELYEHLKGYNDISLSCRFCRSTFNSVYCYSYHKKERLCAEGLKDKNVHSNAASTTTPKYKCVKCENLFISKKNFQSHILEVHGWKLKNSLYCCKLCNETFSEKKTFFRHYKKHHCRFDDISESEINIQDEQSKYGIEQLDGGSTLKKGEHELETVTDSSRYVDNTDEVFASVEDQGNVIKEEEEEEEEDTEFECAYCGKKMIKKNLLAVHLKAHFKNNEHICVPCKKQFIKYRYYKRHLKSFSHINNSKSDVTSACKCDLCNKIYPHNEALSTHLLKIHKIKDKYMCCPICDFKTVFTCSLNRHIMLHTSNRQFICEECGACFNSSSALKDHKVYIHSNERNYSCEKCGQTFKLKSGLNRHYKSHSDERNEKCFCGQEYKLVTNLRKHQLIAHGKVSNRKIISKVIYEDDGYIMNSPKMVKLQLQANKDEMESKNIEDLDIQPMSVLADVDLSCAGDVLQDSYNFGEYPEDDNIGRQSISSMLTPIYLVETVMQNSNILTSVNQHTIPKQDTLQYNQTLSDISYLQNIGLQSRTHMNNSNHSDQSSLSANVNTNPVPEYILQNLGM